MEVAGWKLVGSFVFPGSMPTFNEVINATKSGWRAYYGIKKKWTNKVQWFLKSQKPRLEKHKEGEFRLEIDWYVTRLTADLDNIGFSRKFICDALEKEGIVPNDNLKHIKKIWDDGFQDRKNPRAEVRIYKRDTDVCS